MFVLILLIDKVLKVGTFIWVAKVSSYLLKLPNYILKRKYVQSSVILPIVCFILGQLILRFVREDHPKND